MNEVELIKSKISIVEHLRPHVELKKKGKLWWGNCPFHDEKTPSFSVNEERGTYYCFGACQEGGDIFTFEEKTRNIPFREILEDLAEKTGVQLRARGKDRKIEYEILERTAKFYGQFLRRKEGKKALEYLISRGLRKEDIVTWQLGFAPPDNMLTGVLARNGWEKEGFSLGVLGEKEGRYYDFFYGRIIFPIRDARGRVMGFGGRILGDGGAKYINSRETPFFRKRELMYGLDRARRVVSERGEALIVEGYLDCILLHAHGYENALAPLGTALTLGGVSSILRYGDAIYVFDGDPAGRKAAERASLFSIVLTRESYVSFLPDGEDPASLLASGKARVFAAALDHKITCFDFLLRKLEERHPGGGPHDKLRMAEDLTEILREVKNPVLKDAYREKALDFLKLPAEALTGALGPIRPAPPVPRKRSLVFDLLALLILFPESRSYAKTMIIPKDLGPEEEARALEYIYGLETVTPAAVYDMPLSDKGRSALKDRISYLSNQEEGASLEKYLKDTVLTLKIRLLESQSQGLRARLDETEVENGEDLLNREQILRRKIDEYRFILEHET